MGLCGVYVCVVLAWCDVCTGQCVCLQRALPCLWDATRTRHRQNVNSSDS